MKNQILLVLLVLGACSVQAQPTATAIIAGVEKNMRSRTRIFESEMVVHGRRSSRTMVSKSYGEGDQKSFTEYLSPAREAGTKMLKLEKQLWIYAPGTDRTIQISGHMLRQSVMGSDLSYEDMMEDRALTDIYDVKLLGEETLESRKVYVLELNARVDDIAYARRKMWIDAARLVPLKEELYARGGQLLKRTTLSEVQQVQGRWFPMKVVYKDMLKDGQGTEFRIRSIRFDQDIPAHIFSKAALKQ
jgi:outer membrane lipoprotein-sorting protein